MKTDSVCEQSHNKGASLFMTLNNEISRVVLAPSAGTLVLSLSSNRRAGFWLKQT